MSNFPVFVFPVSLDFYVGARQTHKQILTIYNPYEFAVKFKVLSTAPNQFAVIDPEGTIAPRSCIDIVIKYLPAQHLQKISLRSTTEKFRVAMSHKATQQALGKRDIPAKITDGDPVSFPDAREDFQPLTPTALPSAVAEPESYRPMSYRPGPVQSSHAPINVVAVAAGICCIGCLLLPTQCEPTAPSQLPDWLHIGASLKFVFSFVLGLVTMLLLRP